MSSGSFSHLKNSSCYKSNCLMEEVEPKVIDNCAKKVDVKDQSLLTNKKVNLPDLLEETKQDCLTTLNKQICFQIVNCDKQERISAENMFVDANVISDKEMLRDVLHYSKDMQRDMEGIISQLQSQIFNLITGYKVLKSKNMLLEHKIKTLKNENVCKQCRKKKLMKEKSGRKNEHSNSEDHADKQLIAASLPSPPRLDPQLLAKISNILSQSENFLQPIEQSLTTLQLKMQKYQLDNEYESNRLSLTSDYGNESDNSFSSNNFYSI